MNLQDLIFHQQLKVIVADAPEGAEFWHPTVKNYIKNINSEHLEAAREHPEEGHSIDFDSTDDCFNWDEDSARIEYFDLLIKLSDIRAELESRPQSDTNVTLSAKSAENKGVEGSEKMTVKLDPAKCGQVNPALPYDEPMVDGELKAPAGMKHDQNKLRYSLIPAGALEAIVGVLEYGARKYAPDNWKHVENARERYYNASMRHIQAWWSGEQNDPETNLPHLAHVACSLMFLMWLDGEQN